MLEIQSNIGLSINIKSLRNWSFIPDKHLSVNRVSNHDSLIKFEDGIHKGEVLNKRIEVIKGGRNTLSLMPDNKSPDYQ